VLLRGYFKKLHLLKAENYQLYRRALLSIIMTKVCPCILTRALNIVVHSRIVSQHLCLHLLPLAITVTHNNEYKFRTIHTYLNFDVNNIRRI
jgi:hypothetical protein